MVHSPQLQAFIDEELDRVALLIDQVLQAVEDRLRAGATTVAAAAAGDAAYGPDLRAALGAQRNAVVRRFCESVREQVGREAGSGTTPGGRATPKTLSLVDESEVTADVELSRTVEAISSVAEYELRELRAYTSALVGDIHVSRDTNPFRPEVYARALWVGASALPLSRGFQVAFMRQAAMPLAQVLRMTYAAATTRLDDAGVEPGAYRTIILPAGTRTTRPGAQDEPEDEAPSDLLELRNSMPVPLDEPRSHPAPLDEVLLRADETIRLLPEEAGNATRSRVLDSQRMRLLNSAGNRVDQQLIELLSRLFDAILTDRDIAPQVQVLLTRLHACALRVALHDPEMLDAYSHPVWQFMDRIAFAAELHPREDDPLRRKLFTYAQTLIDNLAREPVQDAALFRWALDRLSALDRHLFEQRRLAAAEQIADLQRLDDGAGSPPQDPDRATPPSPLDVATLDTVPAELLDITATPLRAQTAAPDWPATHRPGDWVRLFLDGHWQIAQLLWLSDAGSLWLYAEAHEGITWALRRGALELLHREGLLRPLKPYSLIEKAAETVLRQVTRQGGTR